MNTKFLTLIFALTALLTFAQTTEHLSFKSVPIDGTIDEYVSKMKQNGFNHLKTNNGIAILNGEFAGYKDCIVEVSTLKQNDLVYKIGVLFSEKETWSTLSSNYFDLKEMLTEKYGKPSNVEEKFETTLQPNDDRAKMYELKFDRCKYSSIWKTDKGDIQLSLDHTGMTSCFVKLLYFDKTNGSIVKAKAKDDL